MWTTKMYPLTVFTHTKVDIVTTAHMWTAKNFILQDGHVLSIVEWALALKTNIYTKLFGSFTDLSNTGSCELCPKSDEKLFPYTFIFKKRTIRLDHLQSKSHGAESNDSSSVAILLSRSGILHVRNSSKPLLHHIQQYQNYVPSGSFYFGRQ